jgi:Rab GDP dissociation inhibitor
MDTDYDHIVLGTGLKECILSGLMSVNGAKVLHMDRNGYYGAESASLNLEQLYAKFRGDEKPPENLGRARDWNVDLCPKFLMACGNLVKVLLQTKVTRYLEFKSISGGYVLKDGKVHKVPATPKEALASSLMGIFQKRRFKNFLQFVSDYDHDDVKTHSGLHCEKMSVGDLYAYWKVDVDTATFTGHAIALELDDSYLEQPCLPFIEKVKLYAYSVSRYGNSPFIYPMWGLGGLPEGFSRLAAIHGGVYMLNKPINKILYDDNGRVRGVESASEEGVMEEARCKSIVADPSYFVDTDKVKKIGQVARCICFLDHPIPDTGDSESCQIILPAKQIPHKSDVYISCISFHHQVCFKGMYLAVVSCNVETDDPHKELLPGLALLGPIQQEFFSVSDSYEAVNDPSKDGCYITSTFDATTHFETASDEVIKMYKALTGKDLDLTISADPDDLDGTNDDGSN